MFQSIKQPAYPVRLPMARAIAVRAANGGVDTRLIT